MKMIRNIITGILSVISIVVFAQQQAQYSMYMINNYTLNPAVGGTEDYTDVKMSYRTQWVGFGDNGGGTKDIYVSGHTSIGKVTYADESVKPLPHHGVGGYVYNDITGPSAKTGVYGSYAYHLPLTSKLTASLGAFVGFQQYRLDASQLRFYSDDVQPETAINGNQSKFLPDANLGVWLYHKNYYVGGSMFQLFNNGVNFEAVQNRVTDGKLNTHFFATAGYRVPINNNFTWVPSFVVKAVSPVPMQFDLNSKFRYQDLAWLGVSYRNKDAVILLAGVTLLDHWDIAYSYDITTSNLRNYSAGSHEFMIGYRFTKDNDVKPTSQFW